MTLSDLYDLYVYGVCRWVSARGDKAGWRGDEPQLARLLPEPQRLRVALRHHSWTSYQAGQQHSRFDSSMQY